MDQLRRLFIGNGGAWGQDSGGPMIDHSSSKEGQALAEQAYQQDDSEMLGGRIEDRLAEAELLEERAPYPTRLRVILLLSLASWALVFLAIAWVAGRL